MLTQTQIIYPDIKLIKTNNQCAVCLDQTGKHKLYKIVSSNFTNHNLMDDYTIPSPYICDACKEAFKNRKLRTSSYIINQHKQVFFKNNEGLQYLINPIKPPFIFGFTKAFKKHTFLYTIVNYDAKNFYIGTDFSIEPVYFEYEKWINCILLLQYLYNAGFSKEDLRTLKPSLNRFKYIDISNIINFWPKYYYYLSSYQNNLVYEIIILMLYKWK